MYNVTMNDLFKKLNVLVKARLNDIVSGEEQPDRPGARLDKHVDADVSALRARINDAVQYEDEIKAQIRQFEDEAARWDKQADAAVTRGDDAAARYAVEQMRRAEQRATMMQSDLSEHQRVTQDLIQRVNTLDATVGDIRHAQPDEAAESARIPDLGNVLRETRDRISSLADMAAAQQALDPPPEEETAAVDDDLERRRQRLSKR